MRTMVGAIILGAAFALMAVPDSMAAPLSSGGVSSAVERSAQPIQYWRGGYCARLRRACEFKSERGEVGQGNCRRYREECGGRFSRCEQLRRACQNKYERG